MQHITLETERLILRRFEQGDAEDVQAYSGNPENLKYMLFDPNTLDKTRSYIRYAIKTFGDSRYEFAVVLKETERVIGEVGINYTDNEGEVGWLLPRDYWRRGYGSELAAALIKFGFETLKLRQIVAHCDAENYGSYRVMERNGMRREGCFIQGRKSNSVLGGVWRNELSYAILAEEYFQNGVM